ncbi:MAG TPA: alpha-L-fucosidase [Gemmatimonadales bacterium]|nr:alpha-L-fucosidase [Gemmatimonadales bacterium]
MATEHPLDRRAFLRTGATSLGAAATASWPPLRRSARGIASGPADERLAWWRDARFGMFIHWGLYSVLAGEWGGRTDYAEWIRTSAHIPLGEYDRLLARFNPTRFDADRWVALAKAAGMRYVTITTKHHDGFGLFDSKLTDFCVRATPFKRDIMREMADACRRHDVRICWYHSIMDWHHPDYLPRRDWEAATRAVDGARYPRFIQYLHGQVTELLTNYGDIGVLWFDGNWESTWTHEMGRALYTKCRSLQPNLIVNNRVEGWSPLPITDHLGDFRTPEQEVPATGWPGVDWESCITMNRNWGYNSHDHDFKSAAGLIGLLVETASKGGNLLLNVGPKGDGTFPEESVERLQALGRWMGVNGAAIYGTTASPFANAPFRATATREQLFLFLTPWPGGAWTVPGLRTPVRKAYLLADPERRPLTSTPAPGGVLVSLPVEAPDPICSVVVLEFDGPPEVAP